MIQHSASHVDHVSPEILAVVLERFKDKTGFFAESFALPAPLTIECGLHGPEMADLPLTEADVFYGNRGTRENKSRLCNRPKRPTSVCSVIGGPHEGHPCVLYTVFGGPITPKEPTDTTIKTEAEQAASTEFWKKHALSV